MTQLGPFNAAFLADLPYDPEVLLFDELQEVNVEEKRVRCLWTTSLEEPITRSQRNHPVRHPKHVSGALMVHATGMLGFVHAYYILGLRHHQGWVGYGTNIHKVTFRKLVPPGEQIIAVCQASRSRIGKVRHFIRYTFEFRHDGDVCYRSEQSAMWLKGEGEEIAATLLD